MYSIKFTGVFYRLDFIAFINYMITIASYKGSQMNEQLKTSSFTRTRANAVLPPISDPFIDGQIFPLNTRSSPSGASMPKYFPESLPKINQESQETIKTILADLPVLKKANDESVWFKREIHDKK